MSRGAGQARRFFTRSGLVRVLLCAIALMPFAPWLFHDRRGLSLIAAACERWFAFQCSRDPARSLHVLGRALPICARCSGIYFGLGFGALLAQPRLGSARLRLWILLAAAAMILDVLSEAWGLRPPSASLRGLTGALLAYPVGVALVELAEPRNVRA